MNLMALFALNFLVARYSGVVIGCLVFGVSIYVAFLSGFRVNIIIPVFSFSMGILFRALQERRFKEAFITSVLAATFPAIGLGMFHFIREFGREFMDPFAYYHAVNRMEGLLQGDIGKSQDVARQQGTAMWLDYDYPLLPRGFVMRAENLIGHFNDFPPLYFVYNFGFVIGFIMLLTLFSLGFRFFFQVLLRQSREPLENLSAAFVIIFTFILLVNGRFLYISQEAFLFGVLIGPWLHYRKKLIPTTTAARAHYVG